MPVLAVDATFVRAASVLVVARDRVPDAFTSAFEPWGHGSLLAIAYRGDEPAPVMRLVEDGTTLEIATRRVHLDGATNFRDAGGLRTPRGPLPWRRRFRSENLARLSTRDWDVLEALGIRLVIDLRAPSEAAMAPTRAPSFVELRPMPLAAPLAGAEDATEAILTGRLSRVTPDDLIVHYERLVKHHASVLHAAADVLDTAPDPLIVHCTAGKDRTGLVVALWQLGAGADLTSVIEDFALSNLLRTVPRFVELRDRIAATGTDPRAVQPYLSAVVPALLHALSLLGVVTD